MRIDRPKFLRLIFALMVALTWTGAITSATAQPQPPPSADDLGRLFKQLEETDARLSRETFDLDAAAKIAGSDDAAVFAWVRDHTRWVPYRGMLRGPVGVLMDGVGNSFDRSLLLAELLHRHGTAVRLAHTVLPDDQAAALLAKLLSSPPVPMVGAIPLRSEKLTKMSTDLSQQVNAQTPPLLAAIKPAEPSPDAQATMIAAIKDHWWIQKQDGDKWIDLDPLLPDAKVGDATVTEGRAILWDDKLNGFPVDDDNAHSVRVSVVSEQWTAGAGLKESTLLTAVIRPRAALGKAVYLTHIAPAWPADPAPRDAGQAATKAKANVLAQHEWVPMLMVGDARVIQSSVSDTGEVNPQPTLDANARVGKSAAGAAQSALDAFGGGGALDTPAAPAKPDALLTAEWVEYEIHVPGEPNQKVRRELFDLIGPAARAAGVSVKPDVSEAARVDAGLAMLGTVNMLILPCQPSQAYVGHTMIGQVLSCKASILEAASTGKDSNKSIAPPPPIPAQMYGMALARGRFSRVAREWFIDRPNVLTEHGFHRISSDGKLVRCDATDIVANDVAPRPASKLEAFAVRLEQGVFDTQAEAAFPGHCTESSSAAATLAAARGDGNADWVTLRPGDDATTTLAKLPPDVRARIAQDLSAGRAVVVPSLPVTVDGRAQIAWWAVDPRTGQTIGVGERGWGTSIAEDVAASLQRIVLEYREYICVEAGIMNVLYVVLPLIDSSDAASLSIQGLVTALDAACAAASGG